MKITYTDNELIELFLLGKMSDKEIRKFKERVENDREFRRKYRLLKTFPEMMSEEGRRELEQKQAETIAKESEKRSGNSPKKYRMVALVSVSVVALAGVALFFILRKPDPQQGNSAPKENSSPKYKTTETKAAPVKDTQAIVLNKRENPAETVIQKPDSGTSSEAIRLLTPDEGKKFSREEMLRFSWIMKTDSFTRFFIVAEGKEKVVLWRGIRPGIREYTVPGGYLYPGKFYWYIGTREKKKTFIVTE